MKRLLTIAFLLGGIMSPPCVLAGCHEAHGADAQPVNPAPDWKGSDRYTYRVRLESVVDLTQNARALEFTLTGELALDPIEVQGEKVEFYATLHGTKLESKTNDAAQGFEALASELTAPFVFKVEKGRVVEYRAKRGLSPFAANIWKTISGGFQFSGRTGTAPIWTADERDATGTYVAEYREGSKPGEILKRKQSYAPIELLVQLPAAGAQKLVPHVVASSGKVFVDGGCLKSIETNEELEVALNQTSPVHSKTALSMKLERREMPASRPDYMAIRNGLERLDKTGPQLDKAPNPEFDAERIGTMTFAKAVALLESAAKDEKAKRAGLVDDPSSGNRDEEEARMQSRSQVFLALTAIFRRQPDTIEQAITKIRAGSPAADPLMDALGSSGSELAQSALLELARDAKADASLRQRVVTSLSRTHTATEATVDAFIAMMSDETVGIHATYGLGTIARRLREAGFTELSDRASKALLARLGAVTKATEKLHVLRGIANSGFAGALTATKPFLEGKDPTLRGAAIEAIRLIQDPAVDPLIAGLVTSEPDVSVRLAALNAAKTREPSEVLARALEQAARSDSVSTCRYRAVQIMAEWLARQPALRATLEYVAKNDEREQVRRAAEAALGS